MTRFISSLFAKFLQRLMLSMKMDELCLCGKLISATMLLNEFLATKSRIKNIVITQFQTFSHRFPFVTVYSHCFTQPTKRSPIRVFFSKKVERPMQYITVTKGNLKKQCLEYQMNVIDV